MIMMRPLNRRNFSFRRAELTSETRFRWRRTLLRGVKEDVAVLNALKTLCVGIVLSAVAYGVYVTVTGNSPLDRHASKNKQRSRRGQADDESTELPPIVSEGEPSPRFVDAEPAESRAGERRRTKNAKRKIVEEDFADTDEVRTRRGSSRNEEGSRDELEESDAVAKNDSRRDDYTSPSPFESKRMKDRGSPAEETIDARGEVDQTSYLSDASTMKANSSREGREDADGAEPRGSGRDESRSEGSDYREQAQREFTESMQTADRYLQENKLVDALFLLSRWSEEGEYLAEEDRVNVMELMDQLAGTVIYSRGFFQQESAANARADANYEEAPTVALRYEVQPGDTLDRIGEMYHVPWQLLAKINGIRDPQKLRAGSIKVLQGPFDALVDLSEMRLTLFLQGCYAGSFPIGTGRDLTTPEGEFRVRDKTENPTYYGKNGAIDAADPENPLGEYWIGLGDHIGIHGTNDPGTIGKAESEGCIRLHPNDVQDVFDILSLDSKVVIVRQ